MASVQFDSSVGINVDLVLEVVKKSPGFEEEAGDMENTNLLLKLLYKHYGHLLTINIQQNCLVLGHAVPYSKPQSKFTNMSKETINSIDDLISNLVLEIV